MMILIVCMVIGGSIVLALQKVANASLGQRIGHMKSSFVNHVVGSIFAALLLAFGMGMGHIHFSGIPFYLFLGGCCGLLLVFFVNYAIPIIGVMASLLCLILAQLLSSVIIDQYGLFTARIIETNLWHIVGISLIGIGSIFVLSEKETPTSR